MAVIEIYACGSNETMKASDKLPSPVSIQSTAEQIWSENTGRAQEGENIAQMIGKSVASKHTYNIKWGILTPTEYETITNKLPRGFFKFGISISGSVPTGSSYYRSEITRDYVQSADKNGNPKVFFKDVSVSVIEQ